MKKIILILCLLLFVACRDVKDLNTYEIVVEVHYPTRVDTVTLTGKSYKYPVVSSYEGSNTIYCFDDSFGGITSVMGTTAPIKILEVKIIE